MARDAGEAAPSTIRLDLPDLGPLGPLLETSPDGFAIVGADGRVLYLNAAAAAILGHPRERLAADDLLSWFSPVEREEVRRQLDRALAGGMSRWSSVVVRGDGQLREVEYSATVGTIGGAPHAVLSLRDLTEARQVGRKAEALTQIASTVAFARSLEATLNAVARSVVRATGTVACGILLVDHDVRSMRVYGTYGIPEAETAGLEACMRTSLPRPVVRSMETRGPVVVRDARRLLLDDPCFAPVHDSLREALWDVMVSLPLVYRNRVVGALVVFYPRDQEVGESELGFLSAIAHQAAIAAENARLFVEAKDKAALEERQRLARELHDSVSQALYGIALGARTARAMLDRDPGKAAEPLDYILALAEAGLAEMRALIFELRPESLETEGLIPALEKQFAAIRARHGLAVEASLPEEPDAPLEVKQAIYRIVQEFVHNTVKHARAQRITVRLEQTPEGMRLDAADDGIGFDPDGSFPGHLGLRSMRERAESLGGTLAIESAPGRGTRVAAHIPVSAASEGEMP